MQQAELERGMFPRADSFHRFAWAVTQPTGHAEEIERFLTAVTATAKSRRRILRKGAILCRAQRGYDMRAQGEDGIEAPDAFLPKRMKPSRDHASEGRANRKDAPCLYLADDPDTATAEVRPWVGAHITLAQFEVAKDCVLVDCSLDKTTSLDLILRNAKVAPDEREQVVWGDIAQAFSKPLTWDDAPKEYEATQVLSEQFKREGYDGVAYKSPLGKGKNFALFDLDAADPINGTLYVAESVSHTFAQANNTYYVAKHYPGLAKQHGVDPSSPNAENPVFLRIVGYRPLEAEEKVGAEDGAPSGEQSR